MSVEPDDLRSVMRKWATGVTVVTSRFEAVQHGMTVNSFTSISLTPPLVLVSLEQSTRTHTLVKKAGHFGVTILASHQQEISECFAGRLTDHEDRFEGLDTHTLTTGSPFLEGGLAWLDCRVVDTYDAGTHTLFIAEVEAVQMNSNPNGEHLPLLYYDRSYTGLQK